MSETLVPSPYPAAGEIVDGKYKIEKILGEGGMGAVARATHVVLGGTLALKFMNPQYLTFPGAVERFVNEGRASKAIKSDHVLPVTDVGLLANGTPYLLMECLYGLDLADLLARDGPSGLPVQRAVHFVVQILRGLQAAHGIGIIHRDMKPSNCFVITHDGEEDFIKILDFGISKVVQPGSSSLTQTNSALGTPLYMSPEQARSPRDVDSRSDLYSVGVILYELLSGRTPFFSESGEFTEILFQLFTADPPPIQGARPDVPAELATVVHHALAREPEDRFATALELAEALAPFASNKTLALIERMRVFKPPTKESVIPVDSLPTSMDALSQLRPGRGTDAMPNRPTTDVEKGKPFTEILVEAPKIQQKTEVIAAPTPRVSAVPAERSKRARPDEALGRTQLEHEPSPREAVSAKPQTDLGATRDMPAESPRSGRSPFVYVLPILAVLGLVGGVAIVVSNGKGNAKPESPPPSAVVTLTAPPSALPPAVVSAPASATPAVASSPSATASASAPVKGGPATKPPPAKPPAPHGTFVPGLDNGIKQ